LGTEVSPAAARTRALALQARLLAAGHPTLDRAQWTAKALYRDILGYLIRASDGKYINESPAQVRELLVQSTGRYGAASSIAVGSVRNFKRDPNLPHFTRKDGGWFDFQLSVSDEESHPILSYDFELRLPEKAPFEFVRFDLNPIDHANESDGRRSHVHLGSDDAGFAIPAPVMTPFEILDVFVHELQPTGRQRRP
jgi:hypothetical protein